MKLRSEYTLNQDLRELANTWGISDEYDRPGIFRIIRDKLTGRFGAAITPSTRKYIANIIGDEFTSVSSDFYPYIPNDAEIGRTYLTVAGKDKKGQTISTAFYIQVKIRESNHEEDANEAFNEFKDSFYKAARSVKEYIDSLKNPQIYISSKFADHLEFAITDRNGKIPEVSLSGESIELPFALAIYSVIIGKPVPTNICATGQFDRHKVLPVSSVKDKIISAICEFEEIERFLHPPKQPLPNQSELSKKIITEEVDSLGMALNKCFDDIIILPENVNFPGIVTFIEQDIEVITKNCTFPGKEIRFIFFPGYKFDEEYLLSIDKIDTKRFNGVKIVSFSNARALWLIGKLCTTFVNICPNIIIYDLKLPLTTGTHAGLVITKTNNSAPLSLGVVAEYKYKES